jgi:predicted hydrocarbon binding protein
MKGSIFRHFESFVTDNWGVEFFEDILDGVDLLTEGSFLGPGDYPEEDLLAIVGATITKLDIPLPNVLRLFGKYLFPQLAGDAPVFLVGATDLRTFLQSVDTVIHVEVKKLWPQAYLPRVNCATKGETGMVIEYQSKRQMCQLFLGLVEGAVENFDTSVDWDETTCTHRGDEVCTFQFNFKAAA